MTRSCCNHQRETIIFLLAVLALFVVLVFRNGGSYMSYLHQDASRAQFEIDQSYVLLISQAEGASRQSGDSESDSEFEHYNKTLIRQFQEKVLQKPTAVSKVHEVNAQTREVLSKILRGKVGGLFIHCCYSTHDSLVTASYLHSTHDWKTLIMEGDVGEYKMLSAQPHSYSLANVVLASSQILNFTTVSVSMKLKQTLRNIAQQAEMGLKAQAQEFPLSFIARSLGKTSVDWLDLNSRGTEFGILKVLFEGGCSVDVVSVDLTSNSEAIVNLLSDKGYVMWKEHVARKRVFYNEERLKQTEKHDMSPLLEKLRQAKMTKSELP